MTTARAIGSATISCNLLSIPVRLYTTKAAENELSFNLLHAACGSRVTQTYICKTCDGVVVERSEMVKGYEHAPGQYVHLSQAELDALDAQASEAITIDEFIQPTEVRMQFHEASYYLGPAKGAERSFATFVAGLDGVSLFAAGSYAARGREHPVVLEATGGGIVMHVLRHATEVRSMAGLPDIRTTEVRPAEVGLMRQLARSMSSEVFDIERFKDGVTERRRALVEAKIAAGDEIAMPAPPPQGGKIIDLVAALKASIEKAKPPETSKPRARPRQAAKPTARRRARRR